MLISVALCTHNGEKFLREQLDSILNQTHPPDELIIGDDASTDKTTSIINEFSKSATFPVKLFLNKETVGYRDNFLQTAEMCSGKYIAFCDQDDVWLPEKLEICLSSLDKYGHLLVSHAFDSVDSQLNFIAHFGPTEDIRFSSGQFATRHTLGFTQVFRRDLLTAFDFRARPLDTTALSVKIAHDQWIPFIADSLGSIQLIAQTLALYRQHGANLYGIEARPSIATKILRTMNCHQASGYRYRSTLSEIYMRKSEILSIIHEESRIFTDEQITNCKLNEKNWRELARIENLRASIFVNRGVLNRAHAWAMAVIDGAYLKYGLKGIKSMLKDLLGGVLYPRRDQDYLRN